MAVTGTFTVSDIVSAALRKIGVVAKDEPVDADDMSDGITALNWMLKSWQVFPYQAFTRTGYSLSLTTATSYTLSPARPLRIINARYKGTDGNEIPMQEMTGDQYDELPNKSSTGTPTQFWYDKQKEAALLYIWPGLSSATTETIEYTAERETDDISSQSDTLDMPVEYHLAVVLNLADYLQVDHGKQNQTLSMQAAELKREILAAERPESYFFNAD